MTKVTTFTGIDISKLSFDVCLLSEEGKEKHKRFSYDKEVMEAFTDWLLPGIGCTMEAIGAYNLKFACHLFKKDFAVSI